MYETKLNVSSLDWSPTGWAGVLVKRLDAEGCMTAVIQMSAGTSIPAHLHTQADQSAFVLEGVLTEEGMSYGPGSFLVAKAGTPHGPHDSPKGCILLTWYSGTPDFVLVE